MIVNSERAIALTCPACRRFQGHSFSLFTISGKPLQLLCPCGFSQGHLRRIHGRFELDVLGADGERIRLVLPSNKLIKGKIWDILSTKDGYELGVVGEADAVEKAVAEGAEKIITAADDFVDIDIMREILEILQDLAERHKIKCECEHPSVGIDLYADRVELVCAFCGSTVIIGASAAEHLERLSRITEIVMEPCTSQSLEEWLRPLP